NALTPRPWQRSVEAQNVSGDVLPADASPGARDTVDACAELFRFCKQCDEKYLHQRGVQCFFDVDSGAMHRKSLGIVCEVIETLLAEISHKGVNHAKGASLTVTLRRRRGVWIFALTEQRIANLRQAATAR